MAMTPPLDAKTPTEVKDYGIDWTDQLAGATITSSTWTRSPDGIAIDDDDIDGNVTLVRLSGGAAASNYTLVNTIVTSEDETLQAAIEVRVRAAAVVAGIS